VQDAPPPTVTDLLKARHEGRLGALERLMLAVQAELRRIVLRIVPERMLSEALAWGGTNQRSPWAPTSGLFWLAVPGGNSGRLASANRYMAHDRRHGPNPARSLSREAIADFSRLAYFSASTPGCRS
jgi:hypothetical protein